MLRGVGCWKATGRTTGKYLYVERHFWISISCLRTLQRATIKALGVLVHCLGWTWVDLTHPGPPYPPPLPFYFFSPAAITLTVRLFVVVVVLSLELPNNNKLSVWCSCSGDVIVAFISSSNQVNVRFRWHWSTSLSPIRVLMLLWKDCSFRDHKMELLHKQSRPSSTC